MLAHVGHDHGAHHCIPMLVAAFITSLVVVVALIRGRRAAQKEVRRGR